MDTIKDLAKRTLYNAAGYGVLKTTGFLAVSPGTSPVVQYIKVGGMLYLVEEGIEHVLTGDSNLRRMDLVKALDDIAFDGVAMFAMDTLNLSNTIAGFIPDVGNDLVDDSLYRGVVMAVVQEVGGYVERQGYNMIKKPISYLTGKL